MSPPVFIAPANQNYSHGTSLCNMFIIYRTLAVNVRLQLGIPLLSLIPLPPPPPPPLPPHITTVMKLPITNPLGSRISPLVSTAPQETKFVHFSFEKRVYLFSVLGRFSFRHARLPKSGELVGIVYNSHE